MKKKNIHIFGKKIAAVLIASLLMAGCGATENVNSETTIETSISEAEVSNDTSATVTENLDDNTNVSKVDLNESKENEENLYAIDKVWLDASLPVEERVSLLLAEMTLEEKAFQMVQPEQANISFEDIAKYGVGSVLSGGGSAPSYGNNPEDWDKNTMDFVSASLKSRLGIPLIYGVDAVHGHNNVYGTTIFPHNIGLGAADDEELMGEIAKVTAEEVLATGIKWDFSPCLGNPQDVTWGRTYECFSEKPEDVARLAGSYVKGLTDNGLVACAKHFIGEGYTENGVNQGDVKMSHEKFDELLDSGVLLPYISTIEAGALTVMPSYNSINGLKCHENYHLLTEVLKDELGFKGFVISDYNAIEQCSGKNLKEQVELSVNAGVDMLMQVSTWNQCAKYIVELVNEGKITEERVNDAVSRILYVKFVSGLFDDEVKMHDELRNEIGSKEHREVARKAVRESLVLLKNEPVDGVNVFDLLKSAKGVTFAGTAANDMGRQCGGWTISWQGMSGNITLGTSVIAGCDEVTGESVKKWLSKDGSFSEESDAIVAVFGEVPYAETDGDRDGLVKISAVDAKMLKGLRYNVEKSEKRVPVVAVILAGRPIDISEYEDMFDAVVMAWLPGTEGSGISDVLFGDYDFNGHLTMTWEMGDTSYPYGYGLTK